MLFVGALKTIDMVTLTVHNNGFNKLPSRKLLLSPKKPLKKPKVESNKIIIFLITIPEYALYVLFQAFLKQVREFIKLKSEPFLIARFFNTQSVFWKAYYLILGLHPDRLGMSKYTLSNSFARVIDNKFC